MIKILIADDHAIVREGLKQILSGSPDMKVIGEAESGDEALHLIRTEQWDVLLLDVTMPGKNVLEVIKLAKMQAPHLPILILSMCPEDQQAIRLLNTGADGFLNKASAPEQLVEAIRKVARGGKYISPTLAEKLLENLSTKQEKPLHTKLTNREFQVFMAICTGTSLIDLASTLALSPKTISTYRTRVMTKMNMSQNKELIHYAIKNELLS